MDYKKLFDLSGKVCVVTGGTGYLGTESAKILKQYGATVVVADVHENAEYWEDAIVSYDQYRYCDLSSTESIRNCFKQVADQYGKIDVLVNVGSYGAGFGKKSQMEFMTDEDFQTGVDGTVGTTFRAMREVIPYMKKAGGSIINYGSMYGVVAPDLRIYGDNPQKQPANYGAGKGGVDQITRYAASALSEYGIRVNSVIPGPFPCPRNQGDKEFIQKLANKTMVGRVGQSYEIAGAILLLASDASTFMTGSNIVVDGGWTAW